MTRIAVVDDIPELLTDTCLHLQQAGYDVQGAPDGPALQALMASFAPDIVVLDIGLPGENGLQIAGRLRSQQPDIGIVMLTGRSALSDRLAGHRQGADHYLGKPLQVDELVLVLRTLERRLRPKHLDSWAVNPAALTVDLPGGTVLDVTRSEACVLAAIARSPQRQCSRQQLATALGEDWGCYDERRLETTISRLRRKLADAAGRAAPLRAIRGQGYGFTESIQIR